jgi:hypothetical protein
MAANSQINDILDNYRKLCAYCDSVWERVRAAYPGEIACRKGCGICCELQTVNQIEAYAIRFHIAKNGASSEITNDGNGACPFLSRDQTCSVYIARPVICRTHGLILRSSEFPLSRRASSCPYNFPSVHPNDFPPELTVDVDVVTKNLVNLNLAFCLASGIGVKSGAETAGDRVPLAVLGQNALRLEIDGF